VILAHREMKICPSSLLCSTSVVGEQMLRVWENRCFAPASANTPPYRDDAARG
jgi:hypothetical protein